MGSLIMAGAWYYQSVGGWSIPSNVNLGLSVLFLGMAAFGAWRNEHRKSHETEAKLYALNRSPVVQILEPIEDGLIGVKVFNLGEKEIRVVSVALSLTDIQNENVISRRICINKSKRFASFPCIMPQGSSFEVMFYHSLNGFLQWGIKSFHAIVETEVGPMIESQRKDISALIPKNCHVARHLKENFDREARIVDFVVNYEFEHNTNIRDDVGEYFPAILRAGITNLQDNIEIHDAFERLSARNFSHPFKGVGINADILGFFRGAEAADENLGGMDGELRFHYWRTENEKRATQVVHTNKSTVGSLSSQNNSGDSSYDI